MAGYIQCVVPVAYLLHLLVENYRQTSQVKVLKVIVGFRQFRTAYFFFLNAAVLAIAFHFINILFWEWLNVDLEEEKLLFSKFANSVLNVNKILPWFSGELFADVTCYLSSALVNFTICIFNILFYYRHLLFKK